MSRRSIVLAGLGIAALVGATAAAPPASAATTTIDVTRDGVTVSVTHVDAWVPTTDKHPMSRYDLDGDGRDEIIITGTAFGGQGGYGVGVYFTRTNVIERISYRGVYLYRGVVGDFDGDGFGDLAMAEDRGAAGSPAQSGGVWVFYGGLGGFDLGRTGHFTQGTPGVPGDPTAMSYFGMSMVAADFDGDHRSELVVGLHPESGGSPILLWGSASGLTGTSARQISAAQLSPSPSPGAVAGFGSSLAAGDVTGDGRPELAVGSSDGRLFLLRGSATGPLTTLPSVITAVSAGSLMVTLRRFEVRTIADVNGDGFGDLVTSDDFAYVNGTYSGAVAVFYGNAQGISAQRRTLVHKHSIGVPGDPDFADSFGLCVSAGDVTGDGYADLIVGSNETVAGHPGAGALYVFRGSAQGVRTTGVQFFTQDSPDVPGVVTDGSNFCDNIVLDLDGTGPLDVLVAAPYGRNVDVFYGGASGLTAVGDVFWEDLVADIPTLAVAGATTAAAGSSGARAAGRAATAAGRRAAAAKPSLPPLRQPTTSSGTLRTPAEADAAASASFVPVGTAARYDFDGDGKDEAVVTTLQNVTVRYSRSGRIDVLTSPAWNRFIGLATAAGDFDHDGFADLVIGDWYDNPEGTAYVRVGAVWICRGSADGLLYDECLRVTQATPGIRGVAGTDSRFGITLAAGDFTGDGYADLAIGAPGEAAPSRLRKDTNAPSRFPWLGSVTVLYGGADGLRPDRSRRITPPTIKAYTYFGSALSAGDVTGDGIADLAVSVTGVRGGTVELYAGASGGLGASPISKVAAADIQGTGSVGFGNTLSIADTNADGRADVLVGAPYADFGDPVLGAVVELRGQASGITAAARRVIRPGAGGVPSIKNTGGFGYWIATGDANADGYADLVVGVSAGNPNNLPKAPGMIMVIPGSAAGLTGTGLATAVGPESAQAQSMGYSVAMLNSDGTGGLEVLAGAPFGDTMQSMKIGAYYEYRLSGSALTLVRTTTAAQVGPPGEPVYDLGFYALHQ